MSLGQRIKEARRRIAGMTQAKLGAVFGVSAPAVGQWESDETKPDADKMPLLAETLKVSIDWLWTGEDRKPELAPAPQRVSDALSDVGSWPRDVPVMGTTSGGLSGDFTLNVGEIVDYARRPPSIARTSKVFVLYVQGTSMARWRQPGEAVYVDPNRPARNGDVVVVECHPEREGEGHPAYLKELVGQTATKLRLKQYNPEGTLELPLARVRKIYRVIDWSELMGL